MDIFLTFLMVPVLSISTHMYIRDEVKYAGSDLHSIRLLSALQKLDYKFLLVPVVIILLRICPSLEMFGLCIAIEITSHHVS